MYGELVEKQREVLQLIEEQTRALTRLVNQLLDLSRFEAGGLPIDPQPVDVRGLVGEVEKSFAALAVQKRIDFRVERADSLPQMVMLDPDRIRHEVLGNLLSNAFKFTPPGGTVELRATTEDGALRIDVMDTGVGIPEDELAHIFEKYYQVGAEAKAKGSGLGLAIVKHVVDAHGGDIEVASEPGRGTTFRIRLPNDGSA
jgi:signal transduction histidine kinase